MKPQRTDKTAQDALARAQAIQALTPEMIALLPAIHELYTLILQQGHNPMTVFNRMIVKLQADKGKGTKHES